MSDSEIEALDLFHARLAEELDYTAVLRGLLREKIFTKTINFEVRVPGGGVFVLFRNRPLCGDSGAGSRPDNKIWGSWVGL